MDLMPKSVLAVVSFCVLAVFPAASQVAHPGEETVVPYAVGFGGSNFHPDIGDGRMAGITGWVDYSPANITRFVKGLSIEAEILALSNSASVNNAHELVFSGGLNYRWCTYRDFRPYGKLLLGYGSVDFPSTSVISHGTTGVTSTGGGFDYRVYTNIWLRADYEYQFWPNLTGSTLHPQGFTIGAVFDLRPFPPRH